MFGPYVHDIDPIIGTVAGVHLWWYGLSYSLGFLNAYYAIRRRSDLGLTRSQVLDLAILLSVGVLLGGRLVMVFHSRGFFAGHPGLIPAIWLGGMATHGLLIGGFVGVGLFCVIHRQPYRVDLRCARNSDGGHPGVRAHRQLHRRRDCRDGHDDAMGREVPERRGLPPSGRAVRRSEEPARSSRRCWR